VLKNNREVDEDGKEIVVADLKTVSCHPGESVEDHCVHQTIYSGSDEIQTRYRANAYHEYHHYTRLFDLVLYLRALKCLRSHFVSLELVLHKKASK
jgi:hypothetical protein